MYAKTLERRTRSVVERSLSNSQFGFRKGRGCTDAIFALRQVSEKAIEHDKNLELVFVDQEKAFDRVSHKYLFQVLNTMGFDGNFIKFIKAMYNEISCQVNVNGKLSRKIKVTRSVRQGCSISMLLFVLSATPIINAIEENNKIEGIKTKNGTEIKILSYADDTTIMVSSEKSIRAVQIKVGEHLRQTSIHHLNKA